MGSMFIILILTVVLALLSLFLNNIIYIVISLLGLFFNLAFLYISLNLEFLGIVQLMINMGGVVVLILFSILLTDQEKTPSLLKKNKKNYFLGFLAASSFVAIILKEIPQNTIKDQLNVPLSVLTKYLITNFLLSFELASFILLGVLILAVTLVRGVKS